jgi:hypothetical protein
MEHRVGLGGSYRDGRNLSLYGVKYLREHLERCSFYHGSYTSEARTSELSG